MLLQNSDKNFKEIRLLQINDDLKICMLIRCVFLMMTLMFLVTGCTQLFFQPMQQHLLTPEQFNIDYEDIYFKGDAGELHGWWFAAQLSNTQKANLRKANLRKANLRKANLRKVRASVLFLHGNGENISTHSSLIYWLTRYQFDVFIFDYRGYGKSEGSVQISGAINDISRARNYVASRNIKGNKLFIIGHSLGASLGIVNIALHKKLVDGMIFVSAFSDYKKITREMMSESWITWAFQWPISMTIDDEFNPVDFVERLPSVPKLFIYSEDDSIIRPQHALNLYEKSSEPKFIEKVNGSHNGMFSQIENQQIIVSYLNRWMLKND